MVTVDMAEKAGQGWWSLWILSEIVDCRGLVLYGADIYMMRLGAHFG